MKGRLVRPNEFKIKVLQKNIKLIGEWKNQKRGNIRQG